MNVLGEAHRYKPAKFVVNQDDLVYEKLIDVFVRPWYQGKCPGFTANVYDKATKELELLKKMKGKKANAGKEAKKEEEKKVVQWLTDGYPSKGKEDQGTAVREERGHIVIPKSPEQNDQAKALLDETIYRMSIKDEQIQDMKKKMSKLNDQLRKANNEIESLRGSVTGSDEYTETGPSAVHNSTKLAEQYSDLLDQEWCDAFKKLSGRDDISKARILHSIIREAFGFCKESLLKQTENIASELLQLHKDTFVGEKEITKELQNLTRTLNSTRQRIAPSVAQRIAEAYVKGKLKSILKPSEINAEVKKYAVRCLELCWHFAISDPPLIISADDSGKDFRSDIYRAYARSEKGLEKPRVEFIVLPALFLNEGGPLISKGVAQPYEK